MKLRLKYKLNLGVTDCSDERMNPETPKKVFLRKGENANAKKHRNFVEYAIDLSSGSYGNFPASKTGYISTEIYIFKVPQKKGLTKYLSS